MKKNLLLLIIGFLIFPNLINAEQVTHSVSAICKSNYNYDFTYNNPNLYVCSNGNTSPYTETIQNTCKELSLCNKGDVRECYVVIDYDCDRTSSGANYFTTTKKTTTKSKTTKQTTTKVAITTTTELINVCDKLKSLTLSTGKIDFKSDVYSYEMEVDSSVNTINVTAVAEDESCKVDVSNNTNIVDGSKMEIYVHDSYDNGSIYTINIKKNKVLSNNANLSSLTIKDYTLDFNVNKVNYDLSIDSDLKQLDIEYNTEDENSKVEITGNENLKNKSIINIKVIAEDGTENNYKINIKLKSNFSVIKALFIIVLVLSLLGVAYYIYKKIQISKSGDKYEYE